ncbi:MAG: hypothetical protein KGH63_02875 [Candidatus Micrarchaeota archaeon]|nr:hypothetical protein [Candidatus Micrarchaeota archaeon]
MLLVLATSTLSAASSEPSTGTWMSEFKSGAGHPPSGSTLVLNVNYKVVNDEDSGIGSYWALDRYTKHVKVWQLPDGSYYAVVDYDGTWNTFAGALSPAGTVSETRDAQGTMHGGYAATFRADGLTGASTHIGTQDLGGTRADILLGSYGNGQTGNTASFNYLSTYFDNPTNFNYVTWGWTYQYHNQVWSNTADANTGNIAA